MESDRFDRLAKSLAVGASRRRLLKGLGGAIGAAVFAHLAGRQAAADCRDEGHPCEGNQDCCDGLVCIVSEPGAALRCTSCPLGQIACGGVCIPACQPSDSCHVAGICDPTAQACTNPTAPNGSACDDNNACTQNDTCQQGTCIGEPVDCDDGNDCTTDTCDPTLGCQHTDVGDGTLCNGGSGHCVSGQCQAGGSPLVYTLNEEGLRAAPGAFPGTFTVSGTCASTGPVTLTFSGNGEAVGPYTGTYTVSGSITFDGPLPPGDDPNTLAVTAFTEQFTIQSAAGVVTGSETLAPAGITGHVNSAGNQDQCALDTTNANYFLIETYYEATISTAAGQYTDQGTGYVQASGGEDFTGAYGTGTFGQAFFSDLAQPQPAGT